VGQFVGSTIPDENSTIRIADISIDGFGSAACFIGGIFNNLQPVNGVNIVQVTLNLNDDHLGFDFGPNGSGNAPAPRTHLRLVAHRKLPRARRPPRDPQDKPCSMTKLESCKQLLRSKTMFAVKQQEQIKALTAQLKEQATQIDKSERPG